MDLIKKVTYNSVLNLLGESVRLHLKTGSHFYFKITGWQPGYITGVDDEGQNLKIAIGDIDFVRGLI